MKKKAIRILALVLTAVLVLSCSSCSLASLFSVEEEDYDSVKRTPMITSTKVPVNETETVDYVNELLEYLQTDSNFAADVKPGINVSNIIYVDDIQLMKLNPATGEKTDDDSLKPLKKSAKEIKKRILSGIDLSVPVLSFANTGESAKTRIYPFDSEKVLLTPDMVVSYNVDVDSSNLNIVLELNGETETFEKIFGIRDKQEVISKFNEECKDYATVNDYTKTYANVKLDESDPEHVIQPVHSRLEMKVEVRQQKDGSYMMTGRITDLKYTVISFVDAAVSFKGSFESFGDVDLSFKMTETRDYDFDFIGDAQWEPKTDAADKK